MYNRAGRVHHGLGKGEALHFSRCIPLRQEQKGRFSMNTAELEGKGRNPRKPSRRGSETRQKGTVFGFRLSGKEYQQLQELSEREGLTVASYLRRKALVTPTTRAIRRPVVEVQVLSKLLAELHKIGSNINQTARRVNMGDTPLSGEIASTLAACRQVARQVTDLLNRNGGAG